MWLWAPNNFQTYFNLFRQWWRIICILSSFEFDTPFPYLIFVHFRCENFVIRCKNLDNESNLMILWIILIRGNEINLTTSIKLRYKNINKNSQIRRTKVSNSKNTCSFQVTISCFQFEDMYFNSHFLGRCYISICYICIHLSTLSTFVFFCFKFRFTKHDSFFICTQTWNLNFF